VARYRGEAEARAKKAEVARAEAAVQVAEGRKRRRVWTVSGGTLLVVLAGAVTVLLGLNERLADTIVEKVVAERRAREGRDGMSVLARAVVAAARETAGAEGGAQELRDRILTAADKPVSELTATDPDASDVRFLRGQIAVGRGAVFAHLSPPDLSAAVGQFALARDLFEALDRDPAARAAFPDLLPLLLETHAQLASAHLASGRAADAEAALDAHSTVLRSVSGEGAGGSELAVARVNNAVLRGQLAAVTGRPTAEILARATAAWEEARAAARRYPADDTVRELLVGAVVTLGDLRSGDPDPGAAARTYDDALALLDELNSNGRLTGQPRWAYLRGRLLVRRGAAALREGKVGDAGRLMQRGGENLAAVEREHPAAVEYKAAVGEAYQQYGYVMWLAGDSGVARFAGSEGAARFRSLLTAAPQSPAYLHGLMGCYLVQANTTLQTGEFSTAALLTQEAAALARRMADAHPDHPAARVALGNCLFVRGLAAEALGRVDEAKRHYAEGQAVAAKLHAEGVKDAQFTALRLALNMKLAALSGTAAEVAAAAADLAAAPGADWLAPFYAACGYATACGKVLAGKKPGERTDADRGAADRYAEAALRSLRVAADRGLKNAAFIERVPDLKPVHDRADYPAVLRALREWQADNRARAAKADGR
jgi:hypothetical protein